MNANMPVSRLQSGATPEIARQDFCHVVGHFATGVAVVTALQADGHLAGFTASSFTSVSLDPPLVLVCVDYRARSYEAVRAAQRFAVHILAEDQPEVARGFAARSTDKSGLCHWSLSALGNPVLDRYHALIECRLHGEHEGGDHAILVGRVERLDLAKASPGPLLYYRGVLHGARGFGVQAEEEPEGVIGGPCGP
jgi:3-hydroxy-9,10-secoandrosta-1,3,5(10)-triene-9,17-dione monooxygenase reductase component